MRQLLLLVTIIQFSSQSYGQSYLAPNNIPQLPTYQSTIPLDLMRTVGQYKQKQYDQYAIVTRSDINNLISTYRSYHSYPIIEDGWHNVFSTDGFSQICYTECNVKNMIIEDVRTCSDYSRNPNVKEGNIITYDVLNVPNILKAKATIVVSNSSFTNNQRLYTIYFIDDIDQFSKQ